MISNMNFYNFMHKQILVLIGLFVGTGLGYVYIGYLYSSLYQELTWYLVNIAVSIWGYRLYSYYKNNNLSLEEKEKWLSQLKYFLFTYFSLWTVIFIMYAFRDNIDLHYIALATQFGSGVVSATILVSQRKLATITLFSIMLPLFIYFIAVDEFYSYLLAFFTFVVSGVLHYASSNTYDYLVKSQFQAYHDYLTKLGNRRFFMELLEDSLRIQEKNNKKNYLLLIDLDHFKIINDTLGHDVGDELLIEVSKRMKSISQENQCTVSRLGGDEFCVLSSFYDEKNECINSAKNIANLLLVTIKEPYNINGQQLYISASIGVSIINTPNINANIFIKEADIAMYEAKNKGRDGVIIFSDDLSSRIHKKLEIERFLHFAIEKNEITIVYQPQLNLKNNKISCEVLARWNNKELGEISPEIFIPISEKTGNIIELGSFILESSIRTLKSWNEKNINIEQMSINISIKQLIHKDFINLIEKLIIQYLDYNLAKKIMFEITETSAVEDIKVVATNIKKLKKYGVKFSMDDFGTGYSSLNYIRELAIDELKIDKVFVHDIENGKNEKIMIKTILDISKNFGLKVVAEGVETTLQLKFLEEHGCDIIQGNYYSLPLEIESFESFIQKEKD